MKKDSKPLFITLLLVFGYFLTRIVNLTVIPVFCDEAIYIRWAQIMRAVQSLRFIPLSDGKQPLFMWLIIPFLKIFSDPLVAGRIVSVLSGLGTMVGMGVLSYLLFKKKEISLFASILYLVSPFCFFFDRMALADGLLSVFGIWYLVFSILLVKNLRLDFAMISGILLGLGLITKSPALFFALMLPLTIFVINNETMKQWSNRLKLVVLWIVVMIFAFAIYNILRLGPEFHMIAIRNKDYVFSLSEILKYPLNPLTGNLKSVVEWYWILLTPPLFILGIFSIPLVLKNNFKKGLFLLLWWLIPLLAQSAIAKVYTSRYILFSVPVFLIFAAVLLEQIFSTLKNKVLTTIFLTVIFIVPFYQVFLLIAFPQRAYLPENERKGYLEMWTAGYGIRESAEYLKEAAKTKKVLVGTEGYFGTLPNGLEMYLEKVPNITIIGVGQPVTEISSKLIDGLKDNQVFLLVNDSRLQIINDSGLKLIKKYPKAISTNDSQESLLLFEILK
ncbi:hypothetical protein COT03_00210 [Candidatus Shapirobacteria bacterium CG07_land_8_20_14_0_80_39_18]|uniref:Glycosyltransferase RgtA/B/C/D-like domain-containing protein n=1 Tax=Candidatus Shapirobacteria bacterium CG07_land_8_20_14_0_80_39_18 TaxID=1974882 RepID=A0A2M6YSB7_9BACT|nr:MAG: hypothetical protein COT03_00210 [Candidatus Shapirobacteria bacterium CG07_land_8_20_14_0_80_39_18]